MNFAVGIVLYNCQINKIQRVISEYSEKDKNVIFVDNASNNIDEVEKIAKNIPNVTIIKNTKNEGIAKALNQILAKAFEIEADYLLTLDQDSFLAYEHLQTMAQHTSKNVAIVCPEIIDLNKKKNKIIKDEYKEVSRCITSGMLMNLNICKKIGEFDEKMFIDYVDFEYCKRIQLQKYKILKIKDCFLEHEIGKRSVRRFFGIYVYPTNHSSSRVYYYIRNIRYYCLKFKKNMSLKEKVKEIIKIVWKYMSIILYEQDKINKLKSGSKGFKDAKKLI